MKKQTTRIKLNVSESSDAPFRTTVITTQMFKTISSSNGPTAINVVYALKLIFWNSPKKLTMCNKLYNKRDLIEFPLGKFAMTECYHVLCQRIRWHVARIRAEYCKVRSK